MKSNSFIDDATYLKRAFSLAKKGQYTTSPNPPVGCVITQDGKIIGEGWHQYSGENHAEVNALNQAKAHGHSTKGATVYVTLEPCNHTGKTPPCTHALIKARIKRVVIALMDVDQRTASKGIETLRNAGIEVDTHTAAHSDIQQQVKILCRGYLSRHTQKRPFTTLKIAHSLDGKIALHNHQSQWISSESARADSQLLRLHSDAIITTSRTIQADNPHYTLRLSAQQQHELGIDQLIKPIKQPILCILNHDLSLPLHTDLNIMKGQRSIWIFYCQSLQNDTILHFKHQWTTLNPKATLRLIPVKACRHSCSKKTLLDVSEVLFYLAKQSLNHVLIEAGAILNGYLLETPLIDEYIHYINTKILGSKAKDGFKTASVFSTIQKVPSLIIKELRQISDYDIKLTMQQKNNHHV